MNDSFILSWVLHSKDLVLQINQRWLLKTTLFLQISRGNYC